ncbi:MAG TPA: hypothetical protein V6C90_19275 [Coleofasciculaceae cyanobacterium]|jgi:hypothetical protein
MPFNLVSPSKKISQLIAQSWLNGERLSFDKNFMVENGLFSEDEAQYIDDIQVVEESPEPRFVGTITLNQEGRLQIYIPYPQRPTDVNDAPTDEQLTRWVNSDVNSEPFVPWDEFSPWIPYTSC